LIQSARLIRALVESESALASEQKLFSVETSQIRKQS
jgi:hypothetical protein